MTPTTYHQDIFLWSHMTRETSLLDWPDAAETTPCAWMDQGNPGMT